MQLPRTITSIINTKLHEVLEEIYSERGDYISENISPNDLDYNRFIEKLDASITEEITNKLQDLF